MPDLLEYLDITYPPAQREFNYRNEEKRNKNLEKYKKLDKINLELYDEIEELEDKLINSKSVKEVKSIKYEIIRLRILIKKNNFKIKEAINKL